MSLGFVRSAAAGGACGGPPEIYFEGLPVRTGPPWPQCSRSVTSHRRHCCADVHHREFLVSATTNELVLPRVRRGKHFSWRETRN